MYKQHRSNWVSSTISALIVTVVVLLIAITANAETGTDVTGEINRVEEVAPLQEVRPQPIMDAASPARDNMPPNPGPRPMMAPGNATSAVMRLENRPSMFRNASSSEMWMKRQEAVADMKARLADKRAALETTLTMRKAALRTEVQNSVVNGAERVAEVLTAAIAKTESIIERLRAKAEEVKNKGVDVTEVLSLLDEADESVGLAKSALEDMDLNVRFAATGDAPNEDWADVREQFAEVRDLIKQAQTSAREAMQLLRSLLVPQSEATNQ